MTRDILREVVATTNTRYSKTARSLRSRQKKKTKNYGTHPEVLFIPNCDGISPMLPEAHRRGDKQDQRQSSTYLELLIPASDPRSHDLGSFRQRLLHHRLRAVVLVDAEQHIDLYYCVRTFGMTHVFL